MPFDELVERRFALLGVWICLMPLVLVMVAMFHWRKRDGRPNPDLPVRRSECRSGRVPARKWTKE